MQTIKDILEMHDVPHAGAGHRHGRHGWVQVDCPWCGQGSGKFHLGISLTTGASSCWRCGKKNTAAVLAALTGLPQAKAREHIDGATLEATPARHTGRLALPYGRQPLGNAHKAYLAGRGLDADMVAQVWGVEGIGLAAKLKWRLFIPVFHYGELVSWTTRSIGTEGQRYLSAGSNEESVPHKHILYGADYAKHAIVIHEGPLDVWATGPGAVATFGTAYSEAQLLAMSRYIVRAVCFDTEPDAQHRARNLASRLSAYPGETHNVVLETGVDAVVAHPDEIKELRQTFLDCWIDGPEL